MRAFIRKKGFVHLLLAGLFYFSVVPTCVSADNMENGGPQPKTKTVNVSLPVATSTVTHDSPNGESFLFANFFSWLNGVVAADEPPMDSAAFAQDDAAAEAPWSILENSDPRGSVASTDGQDANNNDKNVLRGNFFQRLAQFYKQDWAGTNPAGSAPAKRGLASPIDSPPFPFSDWGYGGSPDIGAPDGNTYPLMSALGLENSRTKIYGWVATSINFSTSAQNNFPVSYDVFPNKIEVNQAVIYVERLPDTVQNDHFDWGYHLTAFYGTDYRFTTAKGY
ncbi:MAG: hypothetical protein WBH24_14800, partial [Candidatus Acidiferrum sp.]